MHEVTQRFLANDPSGIPGDCVRAAVASLLDREPTSVPHFIAGSDIDSRVWWYALKGWAAENGWNVTRRGLLPRQEDVPLPEFGLACGPSERGVSHAVVVVGGRIAWDPHPSRAGILRVKEVVEFTPAEAADDTDEMRPDECERCGGVPCSECGECPRQGCWECTCDRRDRDDEERDGCPDGCECDGTWEE